ncbi:hypothetical protein HAX54_022516, partial [Datura stramonium]|nr:hypothetical protein [Datura stramonium]
MEAEAVAIRVAIYECISMYVTEIQMETDSLAMIKFLSGEWNIPWNIDNKIEDIINLSQVCK